MQTLSRLITPEQKQQFLEEGYCVVPGLFSETEIAEIEVFFEDFKQNGSEDLRRSTATEEATRTHESPRQSGRCILTVTVKRRRTGCSTPAWAKFRGTARPARARRPDHVLLQAARRQGPGHAPGQHLSLAKPHTCIAAWTAIDAADLDNGCLWVVPQSHKSTSSARKRAAKSG